MWSSSVPMLVFCTGQRGCRVLLKKRTLQIKKQELTMMVDKQVFTVENVPLKLISAKENYSTYPRKLKSQDCLCLRLRYIVNKTV